MIELDKPMPSSTEAETTVLGAIILNPHAADRVAATLKREHFHSERHGIIYDALIELRRTAGDLDTLTLQEFLRSRGDLDRIGGRPFLESLIDTIPDSARIEMYAATVVEKAELRRIVTTCMAAVQSAMTHEPSTEIASRLLSDMTRLSVPDDRMSRGIHSIVREVRYAADERAERGEMVGIETGWPRFDGLTQGLPRKALSILAAPTSHGKTAFALNLAWNAAERRSDLRVAMYSLEMSRQAIADRLRTHVSGVPFRRIREWRVLNAADRARLIECEDSLVPYNSRFFFADRITTISELVTDARRLKASSGLNLVVVDYLQLLEGVDDRQREREVNQIAWQLFAMARDLDLAVLALSQVTPAANQRTSGRLSIDDVRDSKAIGHHARTVLMLQRPWQSDKTARVLPCATTLQIEKNSEGTTGDLDFHFDGSTQTFDEGECPISCRNRKAS